MASLFPVSGMQVTEPMGRNRKGAGASAPAPLSEYCRGSLAFIVVDDAIVRFLNVSALR